MGRWGTYPTTVDDLRTLSIALLKKYGYLRTNTIQSGTVIWTSSNGVKNTIGVQSSIIDEVGTITLDYTYQETKEINYNIKLITRKSNLGRGLLWFFVCPHTGVICRKLHFISGYFLHRTAGSNLMYESQIKSKKWREWDKTFGLYYKDDYNNIVNKKYYKCFYKGKITKRYEKYLRLQRKLDTFDKKLFKSSMLGRLL